ncbi:unnamed protein product [Cylindrotheca closterium]|uniref:G-protein coupled receptors family 3 profile domain-containing protein n=1 Tax=Cylindrotheca closterium TaxID=2856 RepID=A0AAD2CK09_9STRA|nr:unnamed protein product [Cylindrotheca closterium]
MGTHLVHALVYLLLATVSSSAANNTAREAKKYRLAIVTGSGDWSIPVQRGWYDECQRLNDSCQHYKDLHLETDDFNLTDVYDDDDKHMCITILKHLIREGDFDAIAAKCPYRQGMPPIFEEAKAKGIPIAVFSGPHEGLGPYNTYVGRSEEDMGRTVARLLKKLRPEGGTYLATYNDGTSAARFHGFKEEVEKDNNRDDRPHWTETPINYTVLFPGDQASPLPYTGPYPGWDPNGYRGITRLGYDGIPWFMEKFAEVNPTAIIFLYQFPMRHHNYTDIVDNYRHKKITYIGVDGTADNLHYIAEEYVDGLVGEQTYEMGRICAKTLHRILTEGPDSVPAKVLTKLISYNLEPDELPDLVDDKSLLGDLKYIGLVYFGIVAVGVVACIIWILVNRKSTVVKASQPYFLVVTAAGVLVLGSTLIPLSFDDNGEDVAESYAKGVCMSIPWLGFSGFSMTFSAMFAKTWRVNQFFNAKNAMVRRIRVRERDVLIPLLVIFTSNTIVLSCWTMIDPLIYVRTYSDGTDLWNREIASIGKCISKNGSWPYLIPLALINLTVIGIACWQAYEARDICSEFAETKYIAMTVFSLTQSFITGLPIVAVTTDDPETFYLVSTLLVFGVCLVVLSLIFIPKVQMQRHYGKMSEADQRKAMIVSVRVSSGMSAMGPGLGSLAFSATQSIPNEADTRERLEGVYEVRAAVLPNASTNDSDQLVAKRVELQMVSSYAE